MYLSQGFLIAKGSCLAQINSLLNLNSCGQLHIDGLGGVCTWTKVVGCGFRKFSKVAERVLLSGDKKSKRSAIKKTILFGFFLSCHWFNDWWNQFLKSIGKCLFASIKMSMIVIILLLCQFNFIWGIHFLIGLPQRFLLLQQPDWQADKAWKLRFIENFEPFDEFWREVLKKGPLPLQRFRKRLALKAGPEIEA